MLTPPLLLCVDDDEDDCIWIEEGARKAMPDIAFVHKTNGNEALDYLQEAAKKDALPCLLLMDINMPYLNGRDTVVRIKENPLFASMSIVIYTTSINKMDVLFFKTKGVEMISKPHQYASFIDTVAGIVNKYCK